MDLLGGGLFVIVIWAWVRPEALGRWLNSVSRGFGPITINRNNYFHQSALETERGRDQ